jgi:hypothetical protein
LREFEEIEISKHPCTSFAPNSCGAFDLNIFFLSDRGKMVIIPHKQNKHLSRLTKWRAELFFLNYRAGGLGINLTAADTCIIYDRYDDGGCSVGCSEYIVF